jgi:two-component system response regulator RpfG
MATVVLIDDQITTLTLLSQLVKSIEKQTEPPQVKQFTSALDALKWLKFNAADLILVDYMLPQLNGIEFISLARRIKHCMTVPIVMISVHDDKAIRYEALDAGATDFLSKPIDHYECRARCHNLLQMRQYQLQLEEHNISLRTQIKDSMQAVLARERETLLRLARAGEYRDEETGNHIVRMAKYSRLIAEVLGLASEECELIELAAPMHDVGKIGIPDHILRKSGDLSGAEFETMKKHTLIGYEILKNSPSKYLQKGARIALGHHENFDGSGYPYGKKGGEIPLEARIVAIADVFDALTSRRPYKEPWPASKALASITDQANKKFDPECVNAFISHWADVLEIKQEFQDSGISYSAASLPHGVRSSS